MRKQNWRYRSKSVAVPGCFSSWEISAALWECLHQEDLNWLFLEACGSSIFVKLHLFEAHFLKYKMGSMFLALPRGCL